MLYAVLAPSICDRNHNRCWANDSGSAWSRGAGTMSGSVLRPERDSTSATAASSALANRSLSANSTPSR